VRCCDRAAGRACGGVPRGLGRLRQADADVGRRPVWAPVRGRAGAGQAAEGRAGARAARAAPVVPAPARLRGRQRAAPRRSQARRGQPGPLLTWFTGGQTAQSLSWIPRWGVVLVIDFLWSFSYTFWPRR